MTALTCLGKSLGLALTAWVVAADPALAEKRYGPGVSDDAIKIGQTMPYSGPVSAWATLGRAEAAYLAMINERGGVNGRKLRLISLDDGYSPPRTVEQTRKLIEQEQVLFLFSTFGTPTNTAILTYTNARHVPNMFLAAIGSRWADPQHFPWSISLWPDQRTEAAVQARYLTKNRPRSKIAVLYQNDDYGKGYFQPLRDALAKQPGSTLVADASYEISDPTIDSQIIALQSSGADTLLTLASPKFAALSIRKVHELGWKPHHLVAMPGSSVASVLRAAGLERSIGLITASFLKDPTDPQWRDDFGMKEWAAWMKKYYPEGDLTDWYNVFGYTLAQAMVYVLQQCGDDLTRENVMKRTTDLKDLALPMLLPGIRINTSPTDYVPIKLMQLMRFDGKQWASFGELSGR
jgi:ABC-type branched-subunit amino acid transport system substrate-binding protein